MSFTKFDAAEFLASKEAVVEFLVDAFESQSASEIAHALGTVARAKGMTVIAEQAGFSGEQVYHSFSAQGNPNLKMILSLMQVLGVQFVMTPSYDLAAE